ncbi:hypothetical protein ECANGB1_2784 [Enterospora canceri]|uniref:Glutathione peroxidase n=1 Tax=Enterospora canceri TaxID=1081671 RepID=A0A1Y1S9X2_9MICR|nr:hypothetical protein ECANGB1_2784 [Enterospora canceri]
MAENKSIYAFRLRDYRNNEFNLGLFRNKVIIIVNVASKCGLSETSYRKIKETLDRHRNQVVFVLCPCKQFLKQEHDDPNEISQFVESKLRGHYEHVEGVAESNISVEKEVITEKTNVVLTETIHVRGSNIDPLFDFLISKKGGFITNTIKWNFSSFLVDRNGEVVARYSPMDFITWNDPKLEAALERKNQPYIC